MRRAVLLHLVLQISSIYCVEVIKDVIYLPTTEEASTEQSGIKKSSTSTTALIPKAWIAGSVNTKGLRAATVCTWVKSLDHVGTGTVFAYVTEKEKVEFGLVGINTKETAKGQNSLHDLFVVVKGKKSAPIDLGLDDVRWHHVCVTWSSRYGTWRVFKDGILLTKGQKMKKHQQISKNGRYYIGGGVFKFSDDQAAVNASTMSEHSIRVSTGFGTVRRKRNVISTETKRMIGKFTDFYVWGKVLTKAQIKAMANCTTKRRSQFNEEVKQATSISNLFASQKRRSKSEFAWAGKNVVYTWDVDTITLQRPATLHLSGNLCGYPISVECESNRMLLSVTAQISHWYNIQEYAIHLADHNCISEQKGNFLVFHIPTMEACGTKREVVGKEAHYTNYVTNSPRPGDIYVGQLFRAKVVCTFPLETSASGSSIVPGKGQEVVGTTPVKNPVTGKPDMEGVFVLSLDDKFTETVREGGAINSGKNFWGGIVVKGINSDNPDDEGVNVVVDECWQENDEERSPMISQQGCNGTGQIIENGRRPDVRMEFSPRDVRENTPTYFGCSFRPCVGQDCAPNCEAQTPRRIGGDARTRKQRDIEEEVYEIRIGPVTARKESDNEDEKGDDDYPSDTFLIMIIIPTVVVFFTLVFTVVGLICCCCKRSHQIHQISKRRWSDRGSTKSKHPIRTQSFTFCRPSYSSYNIYPRSFHEAVRSKLQSNHIKEVAEEESEQNTNTMVSTVN